MEAYKLAGGGFPDTTTTVAIGILDALAGGAAGDVELKFHKTFILPANALQAIGRLVRLAAASEMAAASRRSTPGACRDVAAGQDHLIEGQLYNLLIADDIVVTIELPKSMTMTVYESSEGVKGDSANNV